MANHHAKQKKKVPQKKKSPLIPDIAHVHYTLGTCLKRWWPLRQEIQWRIMSVRLHAKTVFFNIKRVK